MDRTDEQVFAAKSNPDRLNKLIEENSRFILGCASRTARRFVTRSDDEWSVALLAFSDAVRDYDGEKGGFRAFAALVIRRRLTDYRRSEARRLPELSVSPAALDGAGEDDEGEAAPLDLELARRTAEASALAQAESHSARDEIEAVQSLLAGYGFSFFDLADASPRAEKTRRSCAEAVKALLSDPELTRRMRETKTLPIREICDSGGVPRKILERHRRYIIAAAEILDGDYPVLAGYLSFIRKAMVDI